MRKGFRKDMIAILRKHGSDVNKPHRFDFYLYVPNKDYADKVEKKLKASGFNAKCSRADRSWLLVASKTITPATANLPDHARFFEQLAVAVGGAFDGWG